MRRESDIVLPKWQPDSEVGKCPVCNTEFSFWFRKHHCRKCGRVVCAACSPHRITIPRQYIVQPPNPFEQEFGIAEMENPMARYLGGGEVVRVCNPCVPDPWTPSTNVRAAEGGDVATGLLAESGRNSDVSAGDHSERFRFIGQSTAPTGRSRAHSHQPSVPPLSRSIPGQGIPGAITAFRPSHRGIAPVPSPPPGRPGGHRYTQSTNSSFPTVAGVSGRPPVVAAPSAPAQPKPRREVREEDECPVCGTELPPGEQIRETHIQECIAARFSSSNPSHAARVQTPPPSDVDSVSGSTPQSNRPRATSYRPRGMALYRATEKDCLTEDGGAQECIICFEEFQPGDEMGRMECLCKFHRQCIRQWWDTKGAGSCPTHQLHE
ncbi:hypothetical protein M433DRAFT_155349 [Acidomyces richmondensis BFW]|nr:MAG: hypothetical protein FE78DRAFT_92079 [Acidomyces sp. 'richmondensis']KYG44682.1 hypothetical protein M433DRAFT_155349 [Acidomyces richmondensis BFW]